MYTTEAFQLKNRKRTIENRLATIKMVYLDNMDQEIESALSLTGPAIIEHLANFTNVGIEKVYIAENDYDTWQEMLKVFPKTSITPCEMSFKDVFDYYKELINNGVEFSDIDLDFTATPDTVMSTVNKFIKGFSEDYQSFTNKFTFTVTFCQRNIARKSIKYYKEIANTLENGINGLNLKHAFYQGYRDGAPMCTAMFLLEKGVYHKKLNEGFRDIEPLLINKGKRQFD